MVSYQTLMADFPKLSADDKAAWRPELGYAVSVPYNFVTNEDIVESWRE
ncbi:MAG TPA: hypothetical protein VGO47_04210 [Chlamydiales bacterium]|nr:hypothetical protein [Chlamydiales bacterium]